MIRPVVLSFDLALSAWPAAAGTPGGWLAWLPWILVGSGGLLVSAVLFIVVLRTRVRKQTGELAARIRGLEQEIAAQRDVEEQERQLQDRLGQAQKLEAMGTLAAGVAHDFNNLLMVISAHAALVKEELAENEELSESLSIVEDAVAQATGFTRSLLTLSRKLPESRAPMDLVAAVERAVQMLHRTLPATIALHSDLSCRPAPWIEADPGQIQQIVLNLAVNARDAMPDGGTLRVGVISHPNRGQAESPTTQLVVSDSGSGIPPAVLPRIFDPFFTTKSGGRGTGLGLAFVHGIVMEYGGRIDLQADPGEGTTFVIDFPLVAEPAAGVSTIGGRDARQGRGERILVAEDRQQLREVVASYLSSLGYEVTQAADGASALNAVRELRPELQLLLLDLDMPRPSGEELLRTMREEGDHTPVIIMTGSAPDSLDDPGAIVMTKPFTLPDLGTEVSRVLRETRVGTRT